jgi:hypothetical protein
MDFWNDQRNACIAHSAALKIELKKLNFSLKDRLAGCFYGPG